MASGNSTVEVENPVLFCFSHTVTMEKKEELKEKYNAPFNSVIKHNMFAMPTVCHTARVCVCLHLCVSERDGRKEDVKERQKG